jgi:hypothetical protein
MQSFRPTEIENIVWLSCNKNRLFLFHEKWIFKGSYLQLRFGLHYYNVGMIFGHFKNVQFSIP